MLRISRLHHLRALGGALALCVAGVAARPVSLAAQSAGEETGSFMVGGTAIWIKATDAGVVHLYMSEGYRDAFARPIAIPAAALRKWADSAMALEVPRDMLGTRDTAEVRGAPAGADGPVFERWIAARGSGVRIAWPGHAPVHMADTPGRDVLSALDHAAELTLASSVTSVAASPPAPSRAPAPAPARSTPLAPPPAQHVTPRPPATQVAQAAPAPEAKRRPARAVAPHAAPTPATTRAHTPDVLQPAAAPTLAQSDVLPTPAEPQLEGRAAPHIRLRAPAPLRVQLVAAPPLEPTLSQAAVVRVPAAVPPAARTPRLARLRMPRAPRMPLLPAPPSTRLATVERAATHAPPTTAPAPTPAARLAPTPAMPRAAPATPPNASASATVPPKAAEPAAALRSEAGTQRAPVAAAAIPAPSGAPGLADKHIRTPLGPFVIPAAEMRSRDSQIRYCYVKLGLRYDPDLTGSVTIHVTMDATADTVTNVQVTARKWSTDGVTAGEVEACTRTLVRDWQYAPSEINAARLVELHFSFRPSDITR